MGSVPYWLQPGQLVLPSHPLVRGGRRGGTPLALIALQDITTDTVQVSERRGSETLRCSPARRGSCRQNPDEQGNLGGSCSGRRLKNGRLLRRAGNRRCPQLRGGGESPAVRTGLTTGMIGVCCASLPDR